MERKKKVVEPREFWLKKIEEFKKKRDFEECLKYQNKIKELDDASNKPEFWYVKGLAYCEIQEFDKALQCFDKDLDLNEPNFDTMYQKGIVYYFLKKNLEAVEWFNKAWELKYSDYLKTKEQIQLLKEHKEFEKTIKHSKKLKGMDPPPYRFWHFQALALTELGKYQEAAKCYDQALSNNKDDILVLYDKARCEFLQGNKNEFLNILKNNYTLDLNFNKKNK